MRIRISLPDDVVEELDRCAGDRSRNAFICELIRHGLENEQRWYEIEAGLGAIGDSGHEWDSDPAEWVRRQRRGDDRRSG